MILITHILIALSSVGYAGYVLYTPSQSKLRMSYGLAALTVVSGVAVIVNNKAQMLHGCVAGLAFVAVSIGLSVLAQRRLATVSVHVDR